MPGLNFDLLVLAPNFAMFGEVAMGQPTPVYTAGGGSPFDTDGIFRIPTLEILTDSPSGSGTATRAPELDMRLSQFPGYPPAQPMQGDTVRVRNVTYRVADVRIDTEGRATLVLAENPT